MTGQMIKRKPVRALVYRQIKDLIQYLHFMPQSVISETELAVQMGISRTPIREALIRLSEEHLVTIYPQSGTYVSEIDFQLAHEIAYMRHILDENVCLKLCRAKTSIGAALEETMYFMAAAMKNRNIAEYIKRDNQFHQTLFALAEHSTMWDIISNSKALYNRVLMLDLTRENALERSFSDHKNIIGSIESGDVKVLKNIMDTHHDHVRNENTERELIEMYPDYFPNYVKQ